LFSPVASSIKEISSILRQFLLAAFFLNSNPDDVKSYVSPITDKQLSEDDIWPLDRLVKEFLHLKENIVAYQEIGKFSQKLITDLEKSEHSFQPNAHSKDIKSRSNFWEERLPSLLDQEKKIRIIEEKRKENEKNALKDCTFKPQINTKITQKILNESNTSNTSQLPVQDRLYKTHKKTLTKKQTMTEENKLVQAQKELSQCTFKPEFVSKNTFEKSMNSKEQPKGYVQNVERMRRGILERYKKTYMLNEIPTGQNYEKIKKANIKAFNITDLNKKENKIVEDENKEDNDNYFSIQVTIPTGKERTLRVHKFDDPFEIAENFCKVYGMKEEIKQRLAKTILQFMNLYLLKK